MTDLVPQITLGDLPDRRRLRQAMLRASTAAFMQSTGEVNEQVRTDYEDIFNQLLQDAAVIPGFGTAQEILLERIAWMWAQQKAFDQDPGGISVLRYDDLVKRFLSAMNVLFRVKEGADANESFKRAFATMVVQAVGAAVNTTVGVTDPEMADRVLRETLVQLQGIMSSAGAR